MDCAKSNNDVIVSEKPNNIIGRKTTGITECGKWNSFYNEDTGKQLINLLILSISITVIIRTIKK